LKLKWPEISLYNISGLKWMEITMNVELEPKSAQAIIHNFYIASLNHSSQLINLTPN